jgi:hypothetical protein
MPRSSKLPANISCFTHILAAFCNVTLPNFELGSDVSEEGYDFSFWVDPKTDATEGHVQHNESAIADPVKFSDLILVMRATYLAHSSLTDLLTCVCPSTISICVCPAPINTAIHCGLFNTFRYPLIFQHVPTLTAVLM